MSPHEKPTAKCGHDTQRLYIYIYISDRRYYVYIQIDVRINFKYIRCIKTVHANINIYNIYIYTIYIYIIPYMYTVHSLTSFHAQDWGGSLLSGFFDRNPVRSEAPKQSI